MDLTVQNVYGLLLRSKLLRLEEAKTMFTRWGKEASPDNADLGKFTRWLINNKYVTEYQASLLLRGHGEGFFVHTYRIMDRLGKGRMGGVYLAEHETGQVVAIKVLPPSKAREKNFLMRFRRETHLAIKLVHENVVRTFAIGEFNGLHYLVMEHIPGETLDSFIKRTGKLSPLEACHLIYQALLGLEYLFNQKMIHRDLKPANLMVTGDPMDLQVLKKGIKILDLGLGKNFQQKGPVQHGITALHITDEGVILGTPDYMAPEQAKDPRAIDIRADIYSLGCVLYHLLAGHPPFPDTNLLNQMIRHATELAIPLPTLNSSVPLGLEQVVRKMMEKSPAERHQTPEQAAQALLPFIGKTRPEGEGIGQDQKLEKYLTWLEKEKTALYKGDVEGAAQEGYLYDPEQEQSLEDSWAEKESSTGSDESSFTFGETQKAYGKFKKKPGQAGGLSWIKGLSWREGTLFFAGIAAGAVTTLLGCWIALKWI